MNVKTDNKNVSEGVDQTHTFGHPADAKIKQDKPQLKDKAKIGAAISSIEDLSSRLEALDKATGPFSASGAFGGNTSDLDSLLDDEPAETAAPVAPVAPESDPDASDIPETVIKTVAPAEKQEVSGAAGTPSLEEEDDLISSLIDDVANGQPGTEDLPVLDEDEPDPLPEVAPEARAHSEADTGKDAGFDAILGDLMTDTDEEGLLDIMDETMNDPIDDMIEMADAALASEEDDPKDEEEDEAHASPFKALFTSVDDVIHDEGDDFSSVVDNQTDTGLEIEEYDPDEELFFPEGGFDDIDEGSDFTGALSGLALEGAEMEVINSSSDEDVSTKNEDTSTFEDDGGPSDLPELTMDDMDDFYAPGTSHDDEEMLNTDSEDSLANSEDLLDDDGTLDEKEDDMAISKANSDEFEAQNIDQNESFDLNDLDDILEGDETDDVAEFDEDALGEFLSETDEDDAVADDPAEALDEDGAVHMLFGDDDLETPDEAEHASADDVEGDAGEVEEVEDATPPAKRKSSRGLLAAAVSVVALVGAGGYAYMNGMLPGVTLPGIPAPAVTTDVAKNEVAEIPVLTPENVSMEDIGMVEGESSPEVTSDEATVLADLEPVSIVELKDEVVSDGGVEPTAEETVNDVNVATELTDQLLGTTSYEDIDVEPDTTEGETPSIEVVLEDLPDMPDDPEFDLSDPDNSLKPAVDLADLADVVAEGDDAAIDLADITSEGDDIAIDLADVVAEEEDIAIDLSDVAAEGDAAAEDAGTPDLLADDPLAALAAEIDSASQETESKNEADTETVVSNAVFVELDQFTGLAETVSTLSDEINNVNGAIEQLNTLMLQGIERDSTLTSRVDIAEQSLRSMSSVLSEFAKVQESLDQTQVVLLDIAARVGTLEAANPADRAEVATQIADMQGEIKRITANMSILARMTVNGVSALTAEGASSGDHGVRTSVAEQPSAGRDTVFAQDQAPAPVSTDPVIPSDISKGDFVEGYGYVLDIVPASGNQKLVVMENGSALVPN